MSKKKFQVVDGILCYKGKGQLRQVNCRLLSWKVVGFSFSMVDFVHQLVEEACGGLHVLESILNGKCISWWDSGNGSYKPWLLLCCSTCCVWQMVINSDTKSKILEACHNDRVGGCHFGHDKTAFKVSQRYYWTRINSDVDDWVWHKMRSYIVQCFEMKVLSPFHRQKRKSNEVCLQTFSFLCTATVVDQTL